MQVAHALENSAPAAPADGAVRPVSLSERAYDEIKQLILRLKLKPGEHVNEAQLAAALQIGRTPVNRAMQRLSFEGLVQILPRKGIVVQPLSLDQVADLIEARRLNEPYCAALAARRITAPELAELKRILKQTRTSIVRRDIEAVMDLDRQFHRVIAVASRNGVILELLMQIHDRSQRFWAFSLSDAGHLDEVLVEHGKIVAALEARDSAAAEAAMQAHIDSFRATMERTIR